MDLLTTFLTKSLKALLVTTMPVARLAEQGENFETTNIIGKLETRRYTLQSFFWNETNNKKADQNVERTTFFSCCALDLRGRRNNPDSSPTLFDW